MKLLRSVEADLSMIYGDMLQLTSRQRRALFQQVLDLNKTNCSWITYRARGFLVELLCSASGARQAHNFRMKLQERGGLDA